MAAEFTPDERWLAALADDCDCGLPQKAREAIALFNAGEYYAQHDLLELLWQETSAPVRELYRAILQLGIAYHQVERDNWRGAMKMLRRSLRWLNHLPDVCQGVDVAGLRANALALRDELVRLRGQSLAGISADVFRPVPLRQNP